MQTGLTCAASWDSQEQYRRAARTTMEMAQRNQARPDGAEMVDVPPWEPKRESRVPNPSGTKHCTGCTGDIKALHIDVKPNWTPNPYKKKNKERKKERKKRGNENYKKQKEKKKRGLILLLCHSESRKQIQQNQARKSHSRPSCSPVWLQVRGIMMMIW